MATLKMSKSIKTIVIYHSDSDLNKRVLPRWLSGFTNVVGLIEVQEPRKMKFKRLKYEYRRVGFFGVIDSIFFRIYHRLSYKKDLERYKRRVLEKYESSPAYKTKQEFTKVIVKNPNDKEVEVFLKTVKPDLVIVRCKYILKKRIFEIPNLGCFIMHPGICPEYRNSHGCFWALVNEDYDNVGMTLLKIDAGVDTGPIYAYYRTPYSKRESPLLVQDRVVFENLDEVRDRLIAISENQAEPVKVDEGRKSGVWGQPHLSAYLKWRIKFK